jgi:transposase
MRKSFNGLVALTESALKQDPLSGSLFVFVNRRRDRIKILYWGQTGFCIWYQQLQRGSYQLPDQDSRAEQGTVEVTRSQLSLILDGIDLSSARQRMRFQLSSEHRAGDKQAGG